MKPSLVFIFCLLFNLATGYGQSNVSLHLMKYTQREGLPSYNVRKVVQDSKGFIWAGTQDGISRFDGRAFLNYAKSSARKHRICGVDVREIIEDTSRNLLWILPGEIGINAISTITGEVVLTVPIPSDNNDDWNVSMISDFRHIWIGTSTGVKIYDIEKRVFDSLPLPAGNTSKIDFEVRSLVRDNKGNIWACYSGYGIVVYDGRTKKILGEIPVGDLNPDPSDNKVLFYNYTQVSPREIVFATNIGLRRISYTNDYRLSADNAPCRSFPELNTNTVDYIGKASNGGMLVSGYGKFFHFKNDLSSYNLLEEATRIGETNWLNAVQSTYCDKQGNTWLACQEGLAFVSAIPNPFTIYSYDKRSNINLGHVRTVFPLGNGDILAGLRNGMIHISGKDGRYTRYDEAHLYHHIFRDQQGMIHVARQDGMFIYENGRVIPVRNIYPEFDSCAAYPVNSHLFINDTTIVLGTEDDHGILVWNPLRKKVSVISATKGKQLLASDIVNNIYEDSKKNIWVLSDNVVTILSPGLQSARKLQLTDEETGFGYKLFFDMCEMNGEFWLLSYGSGLICLDSALRIKNVINSEKGLSNDAVYQVHKIDGQRMMVTSNVGLSVVDVTTLKVKAYYAKNGLHSNSFEEVAGTATGGLVYAGGMNGFTKIDPLLFSTSTTKPLLYINNIQVRTASGVMDTMNLELKLFKIPPYALQTLISFSSINFADIGNTTIQYRIKEQYSEWISIGNSQALPLVGLSPGTYHLQVKAMNEDGISSEIKELTLVFLPKWYQTWWFKTLLGLVVASIIFTIYRVRINQIRKEERIRSRLASDLHDDLGSTFNSIKVYSNLALMQSGNTDYLNKIKEGTQDAIIGIRDMIWVLDDKKDTIGDLLNRIRQFAAPLCEAEGITFNTNADAGLNYHKLRKEEKRNLYLILKEAINNSIKYAQCTAISLTIRSTGKKLSITITDNGKGFDLSQAKQGNGLRNIPARAAEIGYRYSVNTSAGNGVTLRFDKA